MEARKRVEFSMLAIRENYEKFMMFYDKRFFHTKENIHRKISIQFVNVKILMALFVGVILFSVIKNLVLTMVILQIMM